MVGLREVNPLYSVVVLLVTIHRIETLYWVLNQSEPWATVLMRRSGLPQTVKVCYQKTGTAV